MAVEKLAFEHGYRRQPLEVYAPAKDMLAKLDAAGDSVTANAAAEAGASARPAPLQYRLIAALAGEAMSNAARHGQKKALAADLSTMQQSIELMRPQREEKSRTDGGSVPAAVTNRAIYQACGNSIGEAGKLPALRQKSSWVASKQATRVPLYQGRWETAVAVAAVLIIACLIGYRDRRPAPPSGASTLQGSNVVQQQMPFVPAKRALANSTSKPQTALGLKEEGRKAPRTDRNRQVRQISEDVTVRYFTPQPAPSPSPRPAASAAQSR